MKPFTRIRHAVFNFKHYDVCLLEDHHHIINTERVCFIDVSLNDVKSTKFRRVHN